LSLFSQIENLQNGLTDLQKEQKKAIDKIKKNAKDPNKIVLNEITDLKDDLSKIKTDQIKATNEIKNLTKNPSADENKQKELEKIIDENQKNIQLMNTNFSKIVKQLEDKIAKFSEFQADFKDNLKSLRDFEVQKNVLKEENAIRDNKIKEAQSDIDKL